MTFLEFIGPAKAMGYGAAIGIIIGAVVTAFIMRPNYPRLPYDVRLMIAREIWKYQEADKAYGDFDFPLSDHPGSLMHALMRQMTIDEAECIRVALADKGIR